MKLNSLMLTIIIFIGCQPFSEPSLSIYELIERALVRELKVDTEILEMRCLQVCGYDACSIVKERMNDINLQEIATWKTLGHFDNYQTLNIDLAIRFFINHRAMDFFRKTCRQIDH